MTLGPFLTNVVSGIVKEETVPFMDLRRAGAALLGKTGKKGTVSKILRVVRREAHCLETLGHFIPVGRKSPFRFVKQGYREPLHKAIQKAVLEKAGAIPSSKVDSEKKPTEVKPKPVTVSKDDAAIYEKLEARRLPNPDAELARLKSNPKVNTVLKRVAGAGYPKAHLIALGHAVEIREAFKDKYYVFIHGQNAKFMIFNLIARRLQEFMKASPVVGGIPLRHPCFTEHVKASQTPDWFRMRCDKYKMGDHKFRNELVCGDAYFGSTAAAESANYFVENDNIGLDVRDIRNVIEKQLKACFPGQDVSPLLNVFMNLSKDIAASLKKKGNLYVVCVPKDKFSKIGYVAGPFGKTHWASRGMPVDKVLSRLQNDDPAGFGGWNIPQIRLLTHKLRPEEGVSVFQETTLPEDFVTVTDNVIYSAIARFIVGDDPRVALARGSR